VAVLVKIKMHVKKGDQVVVLSGKDKGKKGKVMRSFPAEGKVMVEGINIVKKHTKPKQRVQGGIQEQPAPIQSSNLMVICPACKAPTRLGSKQLKDGTRVRACKKCEENIDK
jgi:large subunit ribosomal protein L24